VGDPRIPLQYERAVLAGAVVREQLHTTTAVRGRAYNAVAHRQEAMPEQLLAPELTDSECDDQEQQPGRREGPDLTSLRALRECRTDVAALDLTAERLRHRGEASTAAADRAHATMHRYAGQADADAVRPTRQDGQRTHHPERPGPRQGPQPGPGR
jgi:hypothetical protein